MLNFGLKILEAIRLVHKAGYVYKDLKLDNIVLNGDPENIREATDITLVDFGFAEKYYSSINTAEGIRHFHVD